MSKKLCSAAIATALAAGLVALSILDAGRITDQAFGFCLIGNPASELSILFG